MSGVTELTRWSKVGDVIGATEAAGNHMLNGHECVTQVAATVDTAVAVDVTKLGSKEPLALATQSWHER